MAKIIEQIVRLTIEGDETRAEVVGELILCKDCKRNADNGGLYPDGRTRCPIQEHYALPDDGHCHLADRKETEDEQS